MTLGFKQQFPWATKDSQVPTYFREKILLPTKLRLLPYGAAESWYPKIHTMRADPTNRWKAGRKIEMVYRGAGYKIIDHFNKGIPELEVCTGVQKVEISWYTYHAKPLEIMGLKGGTHREPIVIIDGQRYPGACSQIRDLAKNDGFDSLEDFYKWFNKDWEGKIIHWTDYRY